MAELVNVNINKQFGKPEINIRITHQELNISASLDDFITAMVQKMESVTWVFTKAEFEKRMSAAKDAIIEDMKKETVPYATNIK